MKKSSMYLSSTTLPLGFFNVTRMESIFRSFPKLSPPLASTLNWTRSPAFGFAVSTRCFKLNFALLTSSNGTVTVSFV